MKQGASIFLVLLVGLSLATFSGCSNDGSTEQKVDNNTNFQADKNNNEKVGYQLEKPENGEEIAIIRTNYGDIKIKFFKEEAPKACENFITHAQKGYYNNLKFHRVINDFMIQTGDPNGNGTGGESIWEEPFEDEFSEHLFNITGAVAMANSGKDTNGSQFFINNVDPKNFHGFDDLEAAYTAYIKNPEAFTKQFGAIIDMSKITNEIKNLYTENGGNPHLDGAYKTDNSGHTVFAQVFEGMDTVNKISKVETNSSNKPIKDVIIKKIEIRTYEG